MTVYTDIEICELEASTVDRRYLLTHGERHFEANATVVELLRCLYESELTNGGWVS